MKLRTIALALMLVGALAFAPTANAEEEQGQDLKAKINNHRGSERQQTNPQDQDRR